jgi:hypothetical protein
VKRGAQVTLFIIIGIVLVLLTSLTWLLLSSITETTPTIEDTSIVQQHITSCITQTALPLLKELAQKGGTFKQTPTRIYHNTTYRYLCTAQALGCKSIIVTPTTLAQELDEQLTQQLNTCLTFTSLAPDIIVDTAGTFTTFTTINAKDITILLTMPLTIHKGGTTTTKNTFVTQLPSDIKTVLDITNHILYQELTTHTFDESAFMTQHPSLHISKHQPYPDVAYQVSTRNKITKEKLTLNFALPKDTINLIYPQPALQTYCIIDNTCYAQVSRQQCEQYGTYTTTKPTCELSLPQETTNKDCADKQHGQSWCVTETASPGFTQVGTQHAKQTCINGKIYTTQCRDFRDEICTQENNTAVCRDNRWEDCAQQTSNHTCMDTDKRDCYWANWLEKATPFSCTTTDYTNQKCFPYIPPGFRHWEGEGEQACRFANEQNECDENSCAQAWVDSTASYCYFQGDCGAYTNTHNAQGKDGYVNTDTPPRTNITNITNQDVFSLTLPTTTQPTYHTADIFNYTKGSEATLNNMFDKWKRLCSVPKITGKNNNQLAFTKLHTAHCSPWQAPTTGACEQCGSDKRKPCTAYQCKSISSGCSYTEVQGYGMCITAPPDTTPPTIHLQSISTTTPQRYTPKEQGYQLLRALQPYTTPTITFTTNENTKCTTSIFPETTQQPTTGYTTEHQLTFTAEPAHIIKQDIARATGIHSITDAYELTSYQNIINGLDQDFAAAGLNTTSIQEELQDKQTRLQALAPLLKTQQQQTQNILGNIAQNTFTRHITCTDEQNNKATTFIQYAVAQDTQAPIIQDIQQDNKKVTLLLNEPSTCRSSPTNTNYQDMKQTYDCTTTAPYTCTTTYTLSSKENYILCQDQPPLQKTYSIIIRKGTQNTILLEGLSPLVSITNNIIHAPAFVLEYYNVIAETTTPAPTLQLRLRGLHQCKTALQPTHYADIPLLSAMHCKKEKENTYCTATLPARPQPYYFVCITPEQHNTQEKSTLLSR